MSAKTTTVPLLISDDLAENPQLIQEMGQRFLETILQYWQSTGTAPVHPEVLPGDFTSLAGQSMPETGASVEDLLAEFTRCVTPGITHVASPRYLGMMNPSPALVAVFAESLTAALNQNCSLWHQSPVGTELERAVVRWLGAITGLDPAKSFGILVSGGSIANITALKLARARATGADSRENGLWGRAAVCVYASREAHYSFEKGMDFLGLGTKHLRLAPVDEHFRVIPTRLREMMLADRAAGLIPAGVIGIAGTTNTGTVDPLDELADLAAEFGAHFHVDAAYGGAAAMLPETAGLFNGLSRADSITLDPHKWFFLPYECAALLVRDREQLRAGFTAHPHYYLEQNRLGPEAVNFFEYGLQGSRSFKALKLWFTFKFFGLDYYRRVIRRNRAFAGELYDFLADDPDFEVFHRPDLAILCFRAYPRRWRGTPAGGAEEVDRLNRAIHTRIEREGRFWIAITRLRDETLALRVNFQNYRTRQADLDEFCHYLAVLKDEESARIEAAGGTR